MGLDRIGIGVDIESIDRFKNISKESDKNFLEKIYTENEIQQCFKTSLKAQKLSSRFSAKEAVLKAINNLFPDEKINLGYNEIEIYSSSKNVPMARILNDKLRNINIKISISHCLDKSVAFAIAELESEYKDAEP